MSKLTHSLTAAELDTIVAHLRARATQASQSGDLASTFAWNGAADMIEDERSRSFHRRATAAIRRPRKLSPA
jgi:hypothetical protein